MKMLLPILLMLPLTVFAAGHGGHDEESMEKQDEAGKPVKKKEHGGRAVKEHGGKPMKEHGGKPMKEHGGKPMKEHGGRAMQKREHAGQPMR